MKFEKLINSIEQTHNSFQFQALKAINVSLTLRNWLIGYYIVEFEQKGEDRAKYGAKLLSNLSQNLKHISGFDERSFRNFRLLFQRYPQIEQYLLTQIRGLLTTDFDNSLISNVKQLLLDSNSIRGSLTTELDDTNISENETSILNYNEIRGTLSTVFENLGNRLKGEVIVNKLSYTHLEQLIRIEDDLQRTFYELECIKGNWSVRQLKRQINSLYFERSGLSQNPQKLQEMVNEKAEIDKAQDIVKSIYTFEFLGLKGKETVEENDLETALLDHLKEFMLEMGDGFCFEARQKKILIGNENYFVDLVFYHRILKCHVLIELKVEEFNHVNIGQLNTYLNYYKSEIMQKDDNPPVGILLVTNKDNALVEFATASIDNSLFVSKYLLELPDKEKLQAFIQNELQKWNR